MRQDDQEFVRRGAEIVVVGPDGPRAFARYWQEQDMPFVGLADPRHVVAGRYEQEVNLLKLGRMPAQYLVDKEGRIRYAHHGDSMSDIPANAEMLALLDQLNGE